MESRVLRGWAFAAALAVTLGALMLQALAGPLPARACSCVMPMPSLEEAASQPGAIVVAGVIGPQQPDRTPVQVDTWFSGPAPQELVWMSFGSQMATSCDPSVSVGERRLLVLTRQDEQLFAYNPCVQAGVIGTPEGDAALEQAQALFGGQPIATPTPTPPPRIGDTPGMDAARLYVVGAVGIGVLLLVGVVLFATLRRRRAND
jgi:hypothetical protein